MSKTPSGSFEEKEGKMETHEYQTGTFDKKYYEPKVAILMVFLLDLTKTGKSFYFTHKKRPK